MSKPLTKGRMIGIRLDLDVDAAIRRRAADTGKSPGLYLADFIGRVARSTEERPVARDFSEPSTREMRQ